MDTTSPSRMTAFFEGMPCTISELIDVQMHAGNPRYPLNDGIATSPRMDSSATASRSAVVMPGVTAALSFSRVRPTTSPASRISAISSSVLIWINVASLSERTECGERPLRHVVDGTHRVDAHEYAGLGVVAHQRCRLLVVDLEPVTDRLRLVVVALEQLATADVTHTLRRRRVEVQMPDVSAAPAGTPSGQPPDHLVVVDHELQDHVEGRPPVEQHVVERLCLRHVAREAVEQEALAGVVLLESCDDHSDRDLVRNEVAGVHELLRLLAELGALADIGAEDVTRRDLRDPEVCGDELGLRPLSRSGGPDEDQTHHCAATSGGSPRSCAASAGSRSAWRCRDPHRRG